MSTPSAHKSSNKLGREEGTESFEMKCGLKQGSVLSPLLFNI